MIRRDSVRPTHRLPDEVFAWKTTLGRGRTRSWLFDSHHIRWSLVLPLCLMCVMLLGYFPLQGDYWFKSLRHPQIWVKLVLWASKVGMRRCVWLIWGFLDDVEYFVVMACRYIIYYLSYLYMLSISCYSTIANQHNLANNPAEKWLVIATSRLESAPLLKPLHV
jgi:hypothetical protein